MTTETTPQPYPPAAESWADDEIDLRKYLLVLVRWWREIALLTLLAVLLGAAVAVAARLSDQPLYQASAFAAIVRTTSDITFDERFQTNLSDGSDSSLAALYNSRRGALVGLVTSGAVAQEVIDRLGALLGEEEQNPAVLLRRIEAEIDSGSGGQSDLIRITAEAESAEKAAAIANTWAEVYVQQTNRLYGQLPNELVQSVQSELVEAQASYEQAQSRLEEFTATNEIGRLERLLAEKQEIITTLQQGRTTAMNALIEEEVAARRQVISAYISALSQNRLLAFTKEQEAKRALLSAYIDAEMENRIGAFEADREMRLALYDRLAGAELDSMTAVFDEQVSAQIEGLKRAYAQKQWLEGLLVDVRSLRQQTEQGGDGAVRSNALTLMLLKTQAFAALEPAIVQETTTETDNTGVDNARVTSFARTSSAWRVFENLQFSLDTIPGENLTAAEMVADLDALAEVIAGRIDRLNAQIEERSGALLAGSGYGFLSELDPARSAVSGPGLEPVPADSGVETLQQAILQRYNDLFDVGGLADASQVVAEESELFANIRTLYPLLFESAALAQLVEEISDDSELSVLGTEQVRDLLQLEGLQALLTAPSSAEPSTGPIDQVDEEIRQLQARLESETARRNRLIRERDLALSTLDTLENKSAELQLADTSANSEVRFAAPAVPPLEPEAGPSLLVTLALAGAIGLMLAIVMALLAHFLDLSPPLARRTPSLGAA